MAGREFYEEYELEPDQALFSLSQRLSCLEDELRLLEKNVHQRTTDESSFIGLPIKDKQPLLEICTALQDHANALNGLAKELLAQAEENSVEVRAWKNREVF